MVQIIFKWGKGWVRLFKKKKISRWELNNCQNFCGADGKGGLFFLGGSGVHELQFFSGPPFFHRKMENLLIHGAVNQSFYVST